MGCEGGGEVIAAASAAACVVRMTKVFMIVAVGVEPWKSSRPEATAVQQPLHYSTQTQFQFTISKHVPEPPRSTVAAE